MAKRLRVGVIFGGKSGEHEVSVQSAKSMLHALDPAKYEAVLLGISRSGQFYSGETALHALETGRVEDDLPVAAVPGSGLPGRTDDQFHAQGFGDTPPKGHAPAPIHQEPPHESFHGLPHVMGPLAVSERCDVVIPVMHGTCGEDGSIQGLLDLLNIPYVGAGIASSAVGLDKVMMKMQFLAAGFPQVRFRSFSRRNWEMAAETVIADVETNLGYPCFVKPANSGSSVGISKAGDRDQLVRALDLAAHYDRKLIVEQGLDAREIEVAVLGNDDPEVSVLGEVISANEFYDYEAKYISGDSTLIIPADVGAQQADEIRNIAIGAFRAVDCSGLARVDFFIEKRTNRVFINEINTMPGFTEHSMYPKLWEESGLPYAQLLDRLIELALQRHADRQRTVSEYRTE